MPGRGKGKGKCGRGKGKCGRGVWDSIKGSRVISNVAGHIPVVGPILGSVLGAFGLGKKKKIGGCRMVKF